MILKSTENVPTTLITFEELMNEIERIPQDLQTKNFAHEREVSPVKQPEQQVEEQWGEDEQQVLEEAPQNEAKDEELDEGGNEDWRDSKPNNAQYHLPGNVARKPQLNKKRVEDDGFTYVPDDRFKPRRGNRGGIGRGGYRARGKWHDSKKHVQREPYTSHGK